MGRPGPEAQQPAAVRRRRIVVPAPIALVVLAWGALAALNSYGSAFKRTKIGAC